MKKIKNIKIINQGSPCDVDIDFLSSGRDKVFEHIKDIYGEENVSSIITFANFGPKEAFKAIASINDVPPQESIAISKLLPDTISKISINEFLADEEASKELRAKIGEKKEYFEYLKDASLLEGHMKQTGVHACGVILSSKPLTSTIPLQTRYRTDGTSVTTTQWVYEDCEALGLVKMDFLGLDTIDVRQNTLEHIKITKGIEINLDEIIYGDLNDTKTFELFQNGRTEGIFQFSGEGVKELCRDVKPTVFEDLGAITALYRPGPMGLGLHTDYAKRKQDEEARVPVNKAFYNTKLEEILSKNFNSLIYQEDLMKISRECAGFSAMQADKLRKAVGKKKMDLLESLEPKFKDGMIKNGYDKNAVDELWSGILSFGEYAFNKSHSYSYALMSYTCAYLKAHYPKEFLTAAIEREMSKSGDINSLIEELKSFELSLSPPNINKSFVAMAPDKEENIIYYGLESIKGISTKTIHDIIEEREENGDYKTIFEFLERNKSILTPSTLKKLSDCGCLDTFGVPRKVVSENAERLMKDLKKTKRLKIDLGLFDTEAKEKKIELIGEEYPFLEKLEKEGQYLGAFLSEHPTKYLKNIDLKSIEDTEKVAVSVMLLEKKKTRGGHNSMRVVLSNQVSSIECYVDKSVVSNILRNETLKKTKGDIEKARQIFEGSIEDYKENSDIEPIIEYRTYIATIQKNRYSDRFTVIDIKPLRLTNDGKEFKEIEGLEKDKEEQYKELLSNEYKDKRGIILRLSYTNGEYIDIKYIKDSISAIREDFRNI